MPMAPCVLQALAGHGEPGSAHTGWCFCWPVGWPDKCIFKAPHCTFNVRCLLNQEVHGAWGLDREGAMNVIEFGLVLQELGVVPRGD